MIFTGSSQRMWALQKLRKLMTYSADQIVNVNTLLASPTVEISESELATRSSTAVSVLCYQEVFLFAYDFYMFLTKPERGRGGEREYENLIFVT